MAQAARDTGAILTVEEHSIYGGLGGAVAECLGQTQPVPLRILGIPDTHVIAGEGHDVMAHYGLDAGGIARAATELVRRK